MACYHPLPAYQTDNGSIVFQSTSSGWNGSKYKPTDGAREIQIPCGRCIGCRIDNSKQWALRLVHEAQTHKENCFITLTYSPENLPPTGSLIKKDYQLFMKRLRAKYVPKNPYCKITQKEQYNHFRYQHGIRFYHCGEYGEKNNRPHYHAILFGFNFDDWVYLKDSTSGYPIYTSPSLEKIWGLGFVTIGTVTLESANYIARYVLKKINGAQADEINPKTDLKHYERINSFTGEIVPVQAEYATMSRRPGIAYHWLDNYLSDVYPKDYTTVNGKKQKPPKYYDKQLKTMDTDLYDQIKAGRKLQSSLSTENTPNRLQSKEKVLKAKTQTQTRNL